MAFDNNERAPLTGAYQAGAQPYDFSLMEGAQKPMSDAFERLGKLRASQMTEEIPDRERWFRDQRRGGWCFSDETHRWPVSDCTAESLSASLRLRERLAPEKRGADPLLEEAAIFVLSRQNDDGAFKLWPGADIVAEFVSLYAQHWLLETQERGRPVPLAIVGAAPVFSAGDLRGLESQVVPLAVGLDRHAAALVALAGPVE
jgi:hypothetical protein